MDFSQHNKINSNRPTNYSDRRQSFVPQVQSFPNSMHPKFQQHARNSSFASCQPSNYQPTNYQQPHSCNQSQQVYSGPDNRNFFPKMSTGHDARSVHPYPGATAPSNSYCGEIMSKLPAEMNYSNIANDEQVSDEEELEEYFQCTPTPSMINKQKNPFHNVMQSMQKYSKSMTSQMPTPISDVNHQTYFFTHENATNAQETTPIDQKLYKSHTKIQIIPKGLRIITEILREDNEEESCGDGLASPDRQTQTNDADWLDKKIEVTVEDNDEINE